MAAGRGTGRLPDQYPQDTHGWTANAQTKLAAVFY